MVGAAPTTTNSDSARSSSSDSSGSALNAVLGSHFSAHLGGSAVAAIVNFPLWKAAAIGQSGFKEAADFLGRMRLIFGPPYKGVAATIFGMTWARAVIFFGSDVGKEKLLRSGCSNSVASTLPPVGIGALVQVINQPIVRSTIMLQDPASTQRNVLSQLAVLYRTRGWQVRAQSIGALHVYAWLRHVSVPDLRRAHARVAALTLRGRRATHVCTDACVHGDEAMWLMSYDL